MLVIDTKTMSKDDHDSFTWLCKPVDIKSTIESTRNIMYDGDTFWSTDGNRLHAWQVEGYTPGIYQVTIKTKSRILAIETKEGIFPDPLNPWPQHHDFTKLTTTYFKHSSDTSIDYTKIIRLLPNLTLNFHYFEEMITGHSMDIFIYKNDPFLIAFQNSCHFGIIAAIQMLTEGIE